MGALRKWQRDGVRRQAAATLGIEAVQPERADVDEAGLAFEREVRGDSGDRGAPHHPVAAGRGHRDALNRPSVGAQRRTENRLMVGRVIDGGGPHLAQLQPLGHRQEVRESPAHGLEVGPVDRPGWTGRFLRIAHSEQQPTLLQPPVQAARKVEGHRLPIDLKRGVRFEHRDLVADGAGGNRDADELADRLELRAAGQEHAGGLDWSRVGENARHPLAGRRAGGLDAGEAAAFAKLDAGGLHGQ